MSDKKIDAIVKRLIATVPPSLQQAKKDLEKNFHAILQSAFNKMDLVTREEFDAQVNVLKRTREKVDALEKQLSAAEKNKKEK